VPPLVDPPVLFAERGASRHVEPDSLEAHRLALRLGATGVLTSVRAGDGGLVLGPDVAGRYKQGFSHLDRGAVYRFNVNHVVEPDDPYEMFPMELYAIDGNAQRKLS
jgi:hypothetical protein